ncbi:MAG TPA: hypothetical protein VFR53_04350 [Methylomirabilota bacterium]|nr:hypothetical protein [Methylomirabilota bacterium]
MTWCRAALGFLLLFPLGAAAQPVTLDDYIRIRRFFEATRDETTRARLEHQAAAAHDTLLATARRSSRLMILSEQRSGYETAARLQTARLVAREGHVTLQALSGLRPQSPDWERAGVVETDAYLAMLAALLRDPALVGEWPTPRFDANAPGPRRAIVVRLTIGEGDREMQALAGPPYERLAALAGTLLEFCRTVPLRPAP